MLTHTLVIEPDSFDGLTGRIEHTGPVGSCHAYDVCGVCTAEIADAVDSERMAEAVADTIDTFRERHGVKHRWWDGEPYRLAMVPRCYLLDWPDDTFTEEARRLAEEHDLMSGRYPVESIRLTEDECEIELTGYSEGSS